MPIQKDLHVEHVGSLLRPAELRKDRDRLLGVQDADHNLGAHDNAELRAIEDRHIRDVVKLQESCGLQVITDGDFRRRSWWTDFLLGFSGLRISYNSTLPVTMINAAGETRPMAGIEITGRIKHVTHTTAAPFKFLKSVTTRTPKATIPGPPIVHYLRAREIVPGIFPSMDAFWDDLIQAYRSEIRDLAEVGCRYLQIDECLLTYLCDRRHDPFLRSRGEDPKHLVEKYTWVINQILAGRPKDMVAAVHMCRGNMNAFWGAEGGYDYIAEHVFNTLDADAYLLEYDTPRAGDFRPLRHMPKGKRVFVGIVSTKDPKLEDADALTRRLDEAAKSMDHAELGLCPQCGFSTNVHGTSFTHDDQRRKIERMVEVAKRVWS